MARIGRIVKAMFERRASAPGKAVVVQIVGQAGEERTVEMYHPPGMSSAPTPKDRVLVLPVGSGAYRIAIATHNYRVEVEPSAGETVIYSTNAAGDTVKATVSLGADGNIEVVGANTSVEGSLSVTLKTGDASIWLPNTMPVDPLTGLPHGGPTAGIVKLKGA